jgi:hypothetical protein
MRFLDFDLIAVTHRFVLRGGNGGVSRLGSYIGTLENLVPFLPQAAKMVDGKQG